MMDGPLGAGENIIPTILLPSEVDPPPPSTQPSPALTEMQKKLTSADDLRKSMKAMEIALIHLAYKDHSFDKDRSIRSLCHQMRQTRATFKSTYPKEPLEEEKGVAVDPSEKILLTIAHHWAPFHIEPTDERTLTGFPLAVITSCSGPGFKHMKEHFKTQTSVPDEDTLAHMEVEAFIGILNTLTPEQVEMWEKVICKPCPETIVKFLKP